MLMPRPAVLNHRAQASGITCLQRRAVWERPLNARLKTNITVLLNPIFPNIPKTAVSGGTKTKVPV